MAGGAAPVSLESRYGAPGGPHPARRRRRRRAVVRRGALLRVPSAERPRSSTTGVVSTSCAIKCSQPTCWSQRGRRRGSTDGRSTHRRGRCSRRLDDHGQEFPASRRTAPRTRWIRLRRADPQGALIRDGPALKRDLTAGIPKFTTSGDARDHREPVRAPRRPNAAEDDGVVMSYVYDRSTDRSDVVILPAQDFTGQPAATIHLPERVPFGFHGNWIPT